MPSNQPAQRFRDISDNIEHIFEYCRGHTRESFTQDMRTRDATERCLMRISEASIKLGDFAEAMFPDYSWSDVRGFGNFVRHDYDNVKPADIWSIVQNDLPDLHSISLVAVEEIDKSQGPPVVSPPSQGD